MATLEEERRIRLLEDLIAKQGSRRVPENPDYLKHISRLLARQQGAPKPPDAGGDYYAPPLTRYVDPRDKYAGTGMSGVANLLGGILQPGRASAIGAMNRQHLESLPQQQAQQSVLLTDTQLEALKQKALAGDVDAQKLLAAYMQAMKPPSYGSGGGGQSWQELARQLREGGVAGKDALGTGERIGGAPGAPEAGAPDEVTAPPVTTPLGPTPPSDVARQVLRDDFQHGATLSLFPEEAIQQATSKLKARKLNEQQMLAMAEGEDQPSPQTLKYIQKARARIEDIDTKLSTISGRPAAGSGTATTAPTQ